jgi:hypothetical protein
MSKLKLTAIEKEPAMNPTGVADRRSMRRWRSLAVASVAAFAAALVVGAADAANILPNAGFESACPGASCGWDAGLLTTIATDTSTKVSGTASLKMTAGANETAWVDTPCVTLSPGPHSASYHYLAPNTNTIALRMSLYAFSGANCSGFITAQPLYGTIVGNWTQATGTFTAPAGTVTAKVYLFFTCVANAACSGNFDDVSFDVAGTTAATMRSFTASRSPVGTLVRWRTAAEIEVAGFNVYRVANRHKVKLNKRLIAARRTGGGASYRRLDRGHRGAGYRLEIVNLDGTRQWRTTH